MKTLRIVLFILIIIGIGLLWTQDGWVPKVTERILAMQGVNVPEQGQRVEGGKLAADYKNATYTIEGKSVTLVNGRAETAAAPGSAEKVVTQYFGNEAEGDLTGDGLKEVAFIITQTAGGSGAFYYAVVAVNTPNGFRGTNAVLLGDRIAPQTTEIKDRRLIVNFADRAAGQPMTAAPSVGVSKYLNVSDNGYLY